MIVKPSGDYEANSLFPNSDWYNQGNYIVDETTKEGQLLAEKIKANYPYMELVIEKEQLVDILPLSVPKKEPEPDIITLLEERINKLEEDMVILKEAKKYE